VDAVPAVVGSVRAAAGAQRSEVMDMPQNETRGLHMGLIDMLSKDGERGADALNAGYDAERLRMRQHQALESGARLAGLISNANPPLSEAVASMRQAAARDAAEREQRYKAVTYDALVAERDALRKQIDALRKSAADMKALNERMGLYDEALANATRIVDEQRTTNAALADVIRMHEQERQRLMLALEKAQHPETAVKPERTDGVKPTPIGITSVR
jgi:hypothetical protein